MLSGFAVSVVGLPGVIIGIGVSVGSFGFILQHMFKSVVPQQV